MHVALFVVAACSVLPEDPTSTPVAIVPPPPSAPFLHLPISCVIGEDCWLTTRPDVDPGPGVRDHAGGSDTRDGHSGTDLSVRHVGQAAATWVLAPAAGSVLRTRDGVPDGELLAEGVRVVDDHECGNAVVLDLGDGWEAQLCHLAAGSLAVRVGDHVDVGTHLGRVGWSGEADHPHVHLTIRHGGQVVDPFTGLSAIDGARAAPGPMWTESIPTPGNMDALAWVGFDAGPTAEGDGWPVDGGRAIVPASARSLVLTVFLWRPRAGDVVRVEITRPDGTTTRSEIVQPRDRPRQTWNIEKDWPEGARPVGLWKAHVEWERAGRKRAEETTTVLR